MYLNGVAMVGYAMAIKDVYVYTGFAPAIPLSIFYSYSSF